MTALTRIDRSQAATVYAAGPLVVVCYPDAAVLVNTSSRVVEAPLPSELSGKSYKDGITDSAVTLSATLSVNPYDYRILIQ